MFTAFEENLWVIAQPAADAPGQWLARCLNADVVSSSTSLEGALRAVTEAVAVCLDDGRGARRRASPEEWRLLERVLRDGQGGAAPVGAEVAAVAQLQVTRRPGALEGQTSSVRRLPYTWLERAVLQRAPLILSASPGRVLHAQRRAELDRSRCGRRCPTWASSRGMSMSKAPEIIVTTQDFERLQRLVACTGSSAAERLDAELARARLVAQTDVPADVVTMNSDVTYEDTSSGECRTVRVVYPKDAEVARGWVSVLAPVGVALLGLRKGQAIEWALPRGTRRLRVLAVPYQPESHGHYAL